jgi:C-terminal processing protease CtpA/Prc
VREGDLIVAIDAQPTGESRLHDIALRLRGQIGSERVLKILILYFNVIVQAHRVP